MEDTIDLTKKYHNLLQRTEDSNTTSFTWDSNVLRATGNSNNTSNNAKISDSNSYNQYLQDELGSPIRLFSPNGDMEEIYSYDGFGQEMQYVQRKKGQQADQFANQQASIIQPFTYTGYQRDSVANTYYAQAREYKPEVGRFTGEDIIKGSIVYPETINRYAYCWNAPMDLVDLNGKAPRNSQGGKNFVNEFIVGTDIEHTSDVSYGNLHKKESMAVHAGGDVVVQKYNESGKHVGNSIGTPSMYGNKLSYATTYSNKGVKVNKKVDINIGGVKASYSYSIGINAANGVEIDSKMGIGYKENMVGFGNNLNGAYSGGYVWQSYNKNGVKIAAEIGVRLKTWQAAGLAAVVVACVFNPALIPVLAKGGAAAALLALGISIDPFTVSADVEGCSD